MGTFVNPGNEVFSAILNSERYVDKTGLVKYLNDCMKKNVKYIASSRPRRFGKSIAANMLAAYYSKGCDSKSLFEKLEISSDPSFEKHLNKYDVIYFDVQWMRTTARDEIRAGLETDIIRYIHRTIIDELKEVYPDFVDEEAVSLPWTLAKIYKATGNQFVIIIDEWDCLFREEKENIEIQNDFISLLRGLFKGQPADQFMKLAYITGILPIKKYGTQSALNNFRELTMVAPAGIAKYIGFTQKEVQTLCKQYKMSYKKMQRWYDGYYLKGAGHVYSPNSVMEAIDNDDFQNYWSQTETYESLKMYIEMDFDGLRQKVIDMLAGKRCIVDVESFQNDMVSIKSYDDVLTLLIHLGYLAYDAQTTEAFIPNEEVRSTFVRAIKNNGWNDVYQAIADSEKLMSATLAKNGAVVADMIDDIHMKHTSSLVYNDENSLANVIQIAYYSAAKDYTLIRELPTGKGFADMVFIPKRRSQKPALVIELKWDKTAKGAIAQIKDKKYVSALSDFKGNIILAGINYDKKIKKHTCEIVEWNN